MAAESDQQTEVCDRRDLRRWVLDRESGGCPWEHGRPCGGSCGRTPGALAFVWERLIGVKLFGVEVTLSRS